MIKLLRREANKLMKNTMNTMTFNRGTLKFELCASNEFMIKLFCKWSLNLAYTLSQGETITVYLDCRTVFHVWSFSCKRK